MGLRGGGKSAKAHSCKSTNHESEVASLSCLQACNVQVGLLEGFPVTVNYSCEVGRLCGEIPSLKKLKTHHTMNKHHQLTPTNTLLDWIFPSSNGQRFPLQIDLPSGVASMPAPGVKRRSSAIQQNGTARARPEPELAPRRAKTFGRSFRHRDARFSEPQPHSTPHH